MQNVSSTSVNRSRRRRHGRPPLRGWIGTSTRRPRRADDPSFLLPLRPCGRLQYLVGGNLFPARIHIVDVEGSVSAVEEQTRARAAGLVLVMTGQGGVCAGQ